MLLPIFCSFLLLASQVDLSASCLYSGLTWSHDILIGATPNIAGAPECQTICYDTMGCGGFTWYNEEAVNFDTFCFVFFSGDVQQEQECQDCTSGPPVCPTCGEAFACHVTGDNFVDLHTSVTSESACQLKCLDNDLCRVYTWFSGSSAEYARDCFLLSSCPERLECDTCATGPKECAEVTTTATTEATTPEETTTTTATTTEAPTTTEASGADCSYLLLPNGTGVSNLMATSVGLQTVQLILNPGCQVGLSILLVGGGGEHLDGGGGSGYVAHELTRIDAAENASIAISVGAEEESTSVIIVTDRGVTTEFRVMPGQDAGTNGGDGYSGGGGPDLDGLDRCSGNGGRDGGDGFDGDTAGGAGSRFNVSAVQMSHFLLSSGRGGAGCCCAEFMPGGLGGGVLVDGRGPVDDVGRHGYGHGGGNDGSTLRPAAGGVVLVEIVPWR